MAISVEQVLEQVRGKSIRSMRHLCFETSRSLQPQDSFELARRLFLDPDPHGAMAGTLIAGHVSYLLPDALKFLREQSAAHGDVRVQDCLARAFDHYCLNRGYERALSVMQDWAQDESENVRRACVEAPRPWAQKEYFAANLQVALDFLTAMRSDASGTVRFSVGRALAEIGESDPDAVVAALKTWKLDQAPVKHTFMFAAKNLHHQLGSLLKGPHG